MIKRYMKKSILVLLALLMLLPSMVLGAAAVSVSDFTDVSSSSWYYDSVSYVVSEGLYNGMSATSFGPRESMTRGMFITVLGRYAGVDPEQWCAGTINATDVSFRSGPSTSSSRIRFLSKGTALTITGRSGDWYSVTIGSTDGYVYASYVSPTYHSFSDVSYSKYYAGYAIWAYEKGYISGDGNAYTFSPNNNITREQICKILNSYASVNGYSLAETVSPIDFGDADDISSWAEEAVSKLQRSGVINGVSDGSGGYNFEPDRSATRAEVAKMICSYIDVTGVEPADKDTSSGGDNGGSETPAPDNTTQPTPTPSATPGTVDAAPIVDTKITLPVQRIRSGLYVSTRYKDTQVASVTLVNTNGSGFDYGTIDSSRAFVKEGSLSASTIVVTTDASTFTVKDGSGNTILTKSGTFAVHPTGADKPLTRVNGGLRYYGDFEFRDAYKEPGYITLINVVDIDDYIKGVLPYEVSPSWPAETLKAAAVATRSYTLSYCQTSAYIADFGFDIVANDGTQTYKGREEDYSEGYFASSDAAVEATANMYLTYNGGFCNCTYFSSSGGATESSKHIWGVDYPYLTGKVDPYEGAAASQISSYTYSITNSRTGSTMNALASKLGLSTLAADGIKINTYEATGNVKSIVLTDVNGNTATVDQNSSMTRFNFLANFGFTWYSYRFSVSYDASSDSFTVTRYGWGHNVGMSQWGAYAMARYYDLTFQDILGFYYTDTEIRYGA